MFQKILLPTDGSRNSAEAASIAGQIAARYGGEVHPLVAVEYQYLSGGELSEEMAAAIRERIRLRAEQALAGANEGVTANGGRADGGAIVEGRPVESILATAEEGEYDLIVMGSRGVSLDSGYDRLVGSVTERVLHRAPCPVLVIRAESP